MYLQLIKRFNAKEKIEIYFETSYSAGIYINEYINGHEIFPIKEFINDYKGTMLGSVEFENFIISLKKYNQRAKNKIIFYGIDLEFQKKITTKISEYMLKKNSKEIYNYINKNKEKINSINSLDDAHFEMKRESYLVNNFNYIYKKSKISSICFMGAWHVRDNSDDRNFIKEIRKNNSNILALEIMYKNSTRTIKEDNQFKTVKLNDNFDKNNYTMYGKIGILKSNKNQGIIHLEKCEKLKMLPF